MFDNFMKRKLYICILLPSLNHAKKEFNGNAFNSQGIPLTSINFIEEEEEEEDTTNYMISYDIASKSLINTISMIATEKGESVLNATEQVTNSPSNLIRFNNRYGQTIYYGSGFSILETT